MKKVLSLLLAVVMVMSLTACFGGEKDPTEPNGSVNNGPQKGGVLNVAYVGGGAQNLDPTGSGWDRYIWSTNVVENFLTRDLNGNLQPGVCEFELSEDNLTLTLWPREGVKFHNGNLVTIDDLKASIEYNSTTQMIDYVRKLLTEDGIVMDYEKNTMTLKFSKYNSQTLYQLSSNNCFICVLPKTVWETYKTNAIEPNQNDIKTIEPKDCIGTGPYKIDVANYVENYKVSLVRFGGYVQKDASLTGAAGPKYAYLDRINVIYASDATVVSMGIMKGEFDIASLPSMYYATMTAANMQVVADPIGNLGYLAFNTVTEYADGQGGNHTDEYMRKAIAAAIDYETLLKVTYGEGAYILENCPMAEGAYYTTKFADADYAGKANIELAKQYLAQSAYKDETIIMLAPSSNTVTGEAIKNMCSLAGIKIEVQYMDDSTYKSTYQKPQTNRYDFVYQASARSELTPSALVTNLRVRFWQNDAEYANEMFNKAGTLMYGSAESLANWDEMSTAWVDNAHVGPIGCTTGSYYCDTDLTVQFPGAWRALYNTYWNNPADHK